MPKETKLAESGHIPFSTQPPSPLGPQNRAQIMLRVTALALAAAGARALDWARALD